ncbi:CD2 antigen cytoplasmic tail-binding protein 2 homolog [Phalaenopsis equestris]|uniref:CD2 antigen cytoplasmic tail-binding protein 2 homolog n=1 Tax=Phalaenopsis equestris TaxID=78828 RepID=UPI0009E60F34|nr:CD2 antigen cytoplasmic tail-binding protein 2 homolog [Phalaenopsis equestris]XP_020591481.1 CD2 antigen cytoplasmic tail-binding protein 2 homolog [Phalaenopsis equestris]XP_020591482.1 CD2 antigen cytoplasmic tail-binding protein 2 homolog [Phalaenopsis equestris]XP_020591483.1 CD2 antigen cytoplasmic tail-binding protein 2 homolog [Phalaenopsis equestris]XP_020591484.1 CD2 antigen cytoplasmic tail-binding protein 2 homolog [Phalaenopsis equestris]XP_020591485.1 CD2 antigen cytoplasmic t
MEEGRGLKRPLIGDDDDKHPPQQRKPRFPKGKKSNVEVRLGSVDGYDGDSNLQNGTNFAAKERAKRRIEKREKDLLGSSSDITVFEEEYEDDSNFEVDGVEIEPFNLQQEREEGYFDENGNYVEYRHEQEIEDAWLDSVSADSRFAEKVPDRQILEEEYEDLSLEEIRTLKRRIVSILQPGENIIHALKRLKGASNDNRAKMSESTKLIFDQLTEDAMKLMENGEYNVYHQERETFERETASKDEDKFDMFGDDEDDDGNGILQSEEASLGSTSDSGQTTHSAAERHETSENFDSTKAVTGGSESDYVYDPSSGYYYSDSLGYYYDPTSKLYCCAASGIWYSFDEQLGTYREVNIASSQET